MAKQQSIVSFDPIESKKELGLIGRLMRTRWSRGEPVIKSEPYGHYMSCGPQGSGKSATVLWYAEKLRKKYKRRKISYLDEDTLKTIKFKKPPRVKLYSNYGLGIHIEKTKIFSTIDGFDPYANEVRIVILDEIHTYFPSIKSGTDKETNKIKYDLIAIFSQLRKRNTYILSTAQVYGRLDKSLREQCLFMINNYINYRRQIVSEFIPEHDIISDDLGRWSGRPKYIYVHGLPKLRYDTKKIIRQ